MPLTSSEGSRTGATLIDAVRGAGAAGVVARSREDAELAGIALAQRDQRGAGVDHEVEPPPVDRALDLEMAARSPRTVTVR